MAGFSMIELMVTIAIMAILLAVALPSFEGSLRSNRLATASNELNGGLALARSEALRNPGGAFICSSTNGTACGGDWNDGWIVWSDLNSDGVLTAADRVLRYVQTNDRLTVTATAVAPASATSIGFDRRGRLRDGGARTITMRPASCPSGVELRRDFSVLPTGQVTILRSACA
ncbi:MAG: GspH/FimT family pseudopilin [Chloroflexi bacterium]|nr:GspH/FimT family pseudopilin [Chloroflexota bacterium]